MIFSNSGSFSYSSTSSKGLQAGTAADWLQAMGIPQVILGLVHVPDLHHGLGLGGSGAVLPTTVGIASTRCSVTCVA